MLLLHNFYTAVWKSIFMNVIPCLNKDDDDDELKCSSFWEGREVGQFNDR